MTVEVDVGAGVKVGAMVKVWVDRAVGDESGEAEFVPAQAERMLDNIHKIPINFDLIMVELL